MNTLQLKIQLRNFELPIYRTILVKDSIHFTKLHQHIQDLFGFEDYHLRVFFKRSKNPGINEFEIKIPDEEDRDHDTNFVKEVMDAKDIHIKDIFIDKGIKKIVYEYDFGDGWEFDITCEKILDLDKTQKYPQVLGGKGGYLIEDCGGPYSLSEMVEYHKNKKCYLDRFSSFSQFREYMKPFYEKIDWKEFKL